jgi:predicted O-methyltransferase YrrM
MSRPTEQNDLQNKYIENLFTTELLSQKQVREKSTDDSVIHMQVTSVEAGIVGFLLKMINAKKVVEVGSLYGYSASWILRSLPKDGELYCLEKSEKCSQQIKDNLTQLESELGFTNPRFKVLTGDAREQLSSLESHGKFDAVFIDADKGAYPQYLTWAEANVRKGGLIIGDNTFLFGEVYLSDSEATESKGRRQAMNDFNKRLSDKTKYNSILIPTHEGLTVGQLI